MLEIAGVVADVVNIADVDGKFVAGAKAEVLVVAVVNVGKVVMFRPRPSIWYEHAIGLYGPYAVRPLVVADALTISLVPANIVADVDAEVVAIVTIDEGTVLLGSPYDDVLGLRRFVRFRRSSWYVECCVIVDVAPYLDVGPFANISVPRVPLV